MHCKIWTPADSRIWYSCSTHNRQKTELVSAKYRKRCLTTNTMHNIADWFLVEHINYNHFNQRMRRVVATQQHQQAATATLVEQSKTRCLRLNYDEKSICRATDCQFIGSSAVTEVSSNKNDAAISVYNTDSLFSIRPVQQYSYWEMIQWLSAAIVQMQESQPSISQSISSEQHRYSYSIGWSA